MKPILILLLLSMGVQAEEIYEGQTAITAQEILSTGICIETQQIRLINRRYRYNRRNAVRLGYLRTIRGRMALEDQTAYRNGALAMRRTELNTFKNELKKTGRPALKCTGEESQNPPEYVLQWPLDGLDDGMVYATDANGNDVEFPVP